MEDLWRRVRYKVQDHMLLGSMVDQLMKHTRYRGEKLGFLYNVMIGQKHRMLYYKKLKREFLKKCCKDRYWEKKRKRSNPDIVWVCWLQGLDQAPLLVKRCVESLEKNLEGKTIKIIDQNNVYDYISIPEDIRAKREKGLIKDAHYSDLIRLELLTRYGGYWIDATVFCTDGSMLALTDQMPLFLYSFYYFGFNPEIMELNNWLIGSTTNNNILCLTKELVYAYWRKYNRVVDYFFFHLFLTMAADYYEDEYKQIPVVSQVDAHILATYIFDPYDETKYQLLCRSTGFHKLSIRFDQKSMEDKNTFYDVVIRRGLNERNRE